MVQYDKWLCWRLLLYGAAVFRLIWNDAPLKDDVLAQSSFHANNLTENEYVTAKTAQDCCVIALDWLVMLAKEDTTDQSSIPALSRRRQKLQDSWQNRTRIKVSYGFLPHANSFQISAKRALIPFGSSWSCTRGLGETSFDSQSYDFELFQIFVTNTKITGNFFYG